MTVKQVFLNGEVITMNSKSAEATAFGIIGNRFWAVGSDDEIRKLVDIKTKVTDLKRKTVIPGFIESHNHISEYATNLLQADCSPNSNQTIDDVKERIRKLAERTEPDLWVKGWGFDDTLIAEKRHLIHADLDDRIAGDSAQQIIEKDHIDLNRKEPIFKGVRSENICE